MSEEKLLILRMMKDGKISEEEAMKLLDAIGEKEFSEKESTERQFDGYSFDENTDESYKNLEESFFDKLSNSIDKMVRKTSEAIGSIDFDDISVNIGSAFSKFNARADRTLVVDLDDLDEEPMINIKNKNGKINVFQWDNEFMEVRARIQYDDKMISANNEFIKVEKRDNTVFVAPDFDENLNHPFNIILNVAVPRAHYGQIDIVTTNGSIEANYLDAKKILVKTTNGKIISNNLRGETTELNSSNATIEVISNEGEQLNVNTSNGKIVLNGVYVKNANIRTSNGRIQVADISSLTKNIDFYTSNGNVKIDVNNFHGPIKVDLENVNRHTTNANISDRFSSVINNGGDFVAYTEGFSDENENSLRINGSTTNGTVNIVG